MKRNAWKELALGAAGVLLLAGCGAPVQGGSNLVGGEDVFTFTRENFPRIDGSTSTVPLAQAICSVLLDESREDVADLTQFSKTTASYAALIYGEKDLLIAAEPAQSVLEIKASQGFAWSMEPFAIEGQVQKIYTGEITNWSEVGGVDEPITAFQRNENAGSQTMMKKLVMDGLDMMEPEKEYVIGEMGALIEAVRGYDNSAGAIGYTVYYYAKNMNMADGLKILRIDDVPPGAESFRSGAYPFLNPYYVVMAADTPEDSPVAVLYRWILSDAGQYLVDREGYVAVRDVEESA